MARIQVLSSFVAEKIAAGEVIERPASVVKELVENSLDAGATEVAVILEDGGKQLIEIIDNGYGMDEQDLNLCFKRHATSKIKELNDLEKLNTLGFRGEALPSIAAVSDMSILSRAKGQETAFETKISEGAQSVTFGHFLGSPHGTRIRARGLFSQVPARLKFLKSQAAEVSQVREWLERLALTHPHVGFRLVSNDRTILQLRPQDEVGRIKAILTDGEDFPVITVESDQFSATHALKVRIHWLQGLSSPQMRKLVQVVNRRAVKDRMLQQALMSPFRQALLPGQFPAVALFIEIDPAAMDVNVHPTKTELRFLDGSKIFRAVQLLAENMIAQHGATGFASGSASASAAFSGGSPENLSGTNSSAAAMNGPGAAAASNNWPRSTSWSAQERRGDHPSHQSSWTFTAPPTFQDPSLENQANTAPQSGLVHPFQPSRYTGIVFNTYLLYDLGDELGLIDQHAAHERVRYEKLKTRTLARVEGQSSQALLIPEATQFPEEAKTTIESRLTLLDQMGFDAEIFGETSLLFRAIPAEWGTSGLKVRLKNLVDKLIDLELSPGADPRHMLLDEKLFESLASEACHSAIRAGDRLDESQAYALVESLFQCTHPWNCPHGRPTIARVPKLRFEEWFQRKV